MSSRPEHGPLPEKLSMYDLRPGLRRLADRKALRAHHQEIHEEYLAGKEAIPPVETNPTPPTNTASVSNTIHLFRLAFKNEERLAEGENLNKVVAEDNRDRGMDHGFRQLLEDIDSGLGHSLKQFIIESDDASTFNYETIVTQAEAAIYRCRTVSKNWPKRTEPHDYETQEIVSWEKFSPQIGLTEATTRLLALIQRYCVSGESVTLDKVKKLQALCERVEEFATRRMTEVLYTDLQDIIKEIHGEYVTKIADEKAKKPEDRAKIDGLDLESKVLLRSICQEVKNNAPLEKPLTAAERREKPSVISPQLYKVASVMEKYDFHDTMRSIGIILKNMDQPGAINMLFARAERLVSAA